MELIRDVVNVCESEDGFLDQAKILVVSHDISFKYDRVGNFVNVVNMN